MRRPDWTDDTLRTPFRAARMHQGSGHWHVVRRSRVLVCRSCGAHVPRSARPSSCPECGAGKQDTRPAPDRGQ